MIKEVLSERIFILCIAFLLDLLLGDPHFLWHPVRGMGSVISRTEKLLRKMLKLKDGKEEDKGKKLTAGGILVLVTLVLAVGVPAALLYLTQCIHAGVRICLECIMCYQMLAMKSLKAESMKVYDAFRREGLPAARKAVSMIVGRDTERLEEEGVIKAAVETVAENTSDGVIAPLFYMLVFGTLGGFFYKAVNTMDSMIGYKNDVYFYLGRAAAKLDDVMNFIPARIAALMMILASFLLGFDGKNAFKIYKRDRYCHASPNSAQTESVCAGALRVRLAGDAWYFGKLYQKPFIGDEKRKVEWEDIRRANRLLYGTSFLTLFWGIAVLLLIVYSL
ncbi:MAG: cobalamin biosynthesis protein CobD [Lachnospiraceae bacterium]|nr:cobalamin biosynthesis protein CobD [Lachnospiraceae bacterium]